MTPLFYIALFLLFFAFIRLFIALLNFLTRPILPLGEPTELPKVSVLIPARNEELNIGKLLDRVINQSYRNIEVLVYDDQSVDNTAAIVEKFKSIDDRVSLLRGDCLPAGWMGKNYACHSLSQSANGNYLLFLDADVMVSPNFVENAVAYAQRKRLVLLSMFPRQELQTMGEKLVVPNMNWILLSLLFLRLVRWSKRPSLAAANGQMMMFEAKTYQENKWHELVRSSPVEDITISRLIKRRRLRMATLLGTDDISCRMYGSYNEAINGFTKNVTAFFGGSVFVTLLFAIVGTIGPIIVFVSLPPPLTLVYLFSLLSARMLIARLSEQSMAINVLLWPIQHLAFLHLVYSALVFKRRKTGEWKGRRILN
ncbi:MAG: glycosyltransferase family 2 protein [Bacteroidales bacterium]|jgi:glycosyltransferase involved in cell wall biosynthesis|nr:glycosyltransferase family 2 protein [Bacteroidales bacterium]MDY0197325.1 glycosyltransferase family 2 protein [Tenuifilaceae bacterium]